MIIVGERINATRTSIAEAIRDHDEERIADEVRKQDEAGAHYIDLNAGTGSGNPEQEAADLNWLIDIALRTTDKRLSLDSSDPEVLHRAFEHLGDQRPAMLNSVNGEAERLEPLMTLAGKRQCPIIALAMDDTGVPTGVTDRIGVCDTLLAAASKAGVPEENLYFDPLVLPLCSDTGSAQITLSTLREIKSRFPKAKTILGLSNLSHGLPRRVLINQAFLIATLSSGLDSAICDPTVEGFRRAMTLGELIAGKDRHCRTYSRRIRKGEI